MHPITAQLTNQSASSQKQQLDVKGSPQGPLSMTAATKQDENNLNSFQYFFEMDIHNTQRTEPNVSEGDRAETATITTVEPNNEKVDRRDIEGQSTSVPSKTTSIKGSESRLDIKNVAEQLQFISIPIHAKIDQPTTIIAETLPRLDHNIKTGTAPVLGMPTTSNSNLESSKESQLPANNTDMAKQNTGPKIGSQDGPLLSNTAVKRTAVTPSYPRQNTAQLAITRPNPQHQQHVGLGTVSTPSANQHSIADKLEQFPIRTPTREAHLLNQPIDLVKTSPSSDRFDKSLSTEIINRVAQPTSHPSNNRLAQTPPTATLHAPPSDVPQNTANVASFNYNAMTASPKGGPAKSTHFSKGDLHQARQGTAPTSPPPTTKPMQKNPPVLSSVTQPKVQSDTIKPFVSETAFAAIGETFSTSTIPHNATIVRAELPIHIARQLAEVAQHLPSRPVEITLSPEELGRVRLSVATSEGGVIVSVLAERPETLDLMRRHIDQLSQEFQALGYQDIAFSFAGAGNDSENTGGDGTSNKSAEPVLEPDNPDTMSTQIHLSAGALSGLDLRL